jgi:hypothetical protein
MNCGELCIHICVSEAHCSLLAAHRAIADERVRVYVLLVRQIQFRDVLNNLSWI